MLTIIALIKLVLFGLPYGVYKLTQHDSVTFKDFVNNHTEEVSGGAFAGMTGVFEFFLINKSEAHDIYIGVVKALVMSAVGYGAAWAVKKTAQWIAKKLK